MNLSTPISREASKSKYRLFGITTPSTSKTTRRGTCTEESKVSLLVKSSSSTGLKMRFRSLKLVLSVQDSLHTSCTCCRTALATQTRVHTWDTSPCRTARWMGTRHTQKLYRNSRRRRNRNPDNGRCVFPETSQRARVIKNGTNPV